MTLTEKILARAAGRDAVTPGEVVTCQVDLVCVDEIQIAIFKRTLDQLGTDRVIPEKTVLVVDHFCPATNLDQARANQMVREFARSHHLRFLTGGIKDQILWENGFIRPGMLLVATDSHVNTCGALGLFAAAFGPSDAAIMAVKGEYWFKVPQTVRCEIVGALPPLVTPKDIGLHILGLRGTDFANYKAIEFVGPTVRELSVDGRITLCNMSTEMGAKNAIIEPDLKTAEFLGLKDHPELKILKSDAAARFSETMTVDVGGLEPLVATPHSPKNVVPVKAAKGVKIDQGFIGSCGNGNMDDLRLTARLLKGRKVCPETRLIVTPSSRHVYQQALAEGLIEPILQSGAMLSGQTCSVCAGMEAPLLAKEVCLTASPRNFQGRMGSPEALIYLASPATIVASAIRGEIVDPRDLL
jgi:3-isopropylmalate/(R)-2-methylmalate dehydratase large subunit